MGSFQLTFSAVSGNLSASETITITVPNPPPGGTTAVRGKVENLNDTPLGNVKITLLATGQTVFSGADGFFTLMGLPAGRQVLLVNGREANLGVFAILAVSVDLIEGVLNNLAGHITLPDVDVEAEVQVSPTFTTVVTNPNLPGVELTILGGTARNSDGTPFTGKLSINPVPDYGRPESRPEELRPGMAVTIQPAGIRFNPPARITFPNADGVPPGNEFNLWSLSPDTGTFNIVGKSAVSADGQSIITVEGGVSASAWHFPLAPSPESAQDDGDEYCEECEQDAGSTANLKEGSVFSSYATPSYRSLGQSRSVSLTYSSVTADPNPVVSLNTTLSVRAAVPNSFSTRLLIGGVQQGGEIYTDSRTLPEFADSISRLAHIFNATNLPTGRYPYQATVFSNYLNSSIGGIANGNVIVVNRKASVFGTGWGISDLQQLHLESAGGVLLTIGNGRARFFSGGPDTFTSPLRDFTTLVRNPDGTYTRTLKDGTKINFSAQGYQTSLVDRNNNTTSYVYNGSNRLATITDPAGLVTTLTYAASSKLQRITDPAGRQTEFQHDSAGNLIRISSPDATFMTYAYDGSGRLTQATDERGYVTTYSYENAGRFSQSVRPGGETRSLISGRLQGLPNTAAGFGTATNPAPIVRSQDAKSTFTDGRGNPTAYTLNGLGQVTSQQDALGQVTTTLYDASGNPTRITRPNGAVTTMTYDAKGNLLTSTDPVGATTTFTYEPSFNQVKTIRDPKGNTTTINYDANGNPIEIIDALGNRTQMTYDARGLLTAVTSAVGTAVQTTTSFTYDARGNLLTTTNPKGDVTTLAYDVAGNVFRSTDTENRVTEFTYDPRNRLITVMDADLKTTQYGYDAKGNLTQVRDAKNQITTFVYDSRDRLSSATNPLGLTETFAYDANGNLISIINRNGQTISFNYDALNRLTSKARPPTSSEVGNQMTTFAFDSVGNLASVSNPATTIINQYDAANRLVSTLSGTELAISDAVVPIDVDTTIGENNFQFDGKTLQVDGRVLTVDGSHTFSNLILVNGAVLRHSPTTATKVNKLDITLFGTLQIDATSRIDVSGRGFLGGFQPGNPLPFAGMTVGFAAGSTFRSGGSYGGLGGVGSVSGGVVNPVYGDFRNPNDVGSGGSWWSGNGGNGGGLVRIVAQTLQLDGSILANGNEAATFGEGGGGSGGGIRIDVGTLRGAGFIRGNGGSGGGGTVAGSGGGGGRVAVYYQDAAGFDLSKVAAFGGAGGVTTNSPSNGGAGTVYLQGSTREVGELIVDNNNIVSATLSTPVPNPATGTIALTHLRVKRGARIRLDSLLNLTSTLEISYGSEFISTNRTNADTINLTANSVITHLPTTATTSFKVDLSANTITIDATSRIDVSGRGFLGGGQPGNPSGTANGITVGFVPGSTFRSGGSYGGLGGVGSVGGGVVNPVYGDFRNPNDVGSGGSWWSGNGGNGGGLVRIVAQTLQLDGSILANGNAAGSSGEGGGGSGGGTRIDVGTLRGAGFIRGNGGSGGGGTVAGSGGGGGRVAVYYEDAAGFDLSKVAAFGGAGGVTTNSPSNGGAGTVYLQGPTREVGELVVDNNGIIPGTVSTPVPNPVSGTIALTNLRVKRGARIRLDSLLNVGNTLEISDVAEFITTNRTIAATINVTGSSVITHLPTTAAASFKVDWSATTLTIDATSRIDVSGRGFLGGGQPGNPFGTSNGMTVGFAAGSTFRSGGSYGGLGGMGSVSGGVVNPVYGDFRNPNDVGSGGSWWNGLGGNGGGLVRIVAQTLQLDGVILANGNAAGSSGEGGGGSGGGIRIDVGTLRGAGFIRGNGGNGGGSSLGGGGGGGGRVAVYYQTVDTFDTSAQITASGGAGGTPGAFNGQNGTIYFEQTFAMFTPTTEEAPVMKATADDVSGGDAVRLASVEGLSGFQTSFQRQTIPDIHALIAQTMSEVVSADRPQRRVFDSAILNPRSSIVETPANLYLAMVADGKLKPFASVSANIAGSGVWSSQHEPRATSTSDDLDPIYTYDLNGNRTSMIDPTGLTTYSYDALNRLTSMTNNKGQVTSFTYDALGRRTSMTHANGVVTSYSYDAASQLLSLVHQLGTTTVNSFNYTYDKVGNRKSKTNRDGAHNYTYDTLNRLIDALNPLPSNPQESYVYDPVGNRTSSNQNGASNFNTANQLLEDANFTYQYDNNGNMTRKTAKAGGAVTQYEYDAENKLVRVVSPGNTANYRYDGLGRRVEKEVIAGTTTVTRYVYDNEDILLELNGSNAITARYTHGPGIDEPLIMEKGGASFYYHADGLGSITELTNQSGSVAQRYTYSSFGKIESQLDPNFVQPYTFTSRELDAETELHHYRERQYSGPTGRFTSEDPLRFLGGINFYSYVGNNPVNKSDPFGLTTYMCKQPLHAIPGTGVRSGPDILGNPLYHEFLCVSDGKGGYVCGGQDRAGRAMFPGSPGKRSDDKWPSNAAVACELADERNCVDECVKRRINDPRRPWYAIGPHGTDCQEWVGEVMRNCQKECKGKK